MKTLTISLLISLLPLLLGAQKTDTFELYTSCSKVKSFKYSGTTSNEIVQSPLLFHYDVKFYHFDLSISADTTFLSGNVTYHAAVTAAKMDTFVVEFIDEMVIDSIHFNGILHSFIRDNDEIFVPLPNPVLQEETFDCRIFYHGTPPQGEFFNGVSKAYNETWGKSVVWTLAEPFNARQWWPAKQVLEDKADSVWVFLTTDSGTKAGSIGLLEQEVSLPGNKVRYEWKSRYPIAYYLISYAVADYQDYSIYGHPNAMGGDSILIQNYVYDAPDCLEQYKTGIDRTVPMLELFSDLYTLYPFHQEKYGHCLTELSGGMEHQTMTTIGNFGFGIVAHELAHMWFGDNVTCATWSDIWVNEGFATYSDYLAHENLAASQYPPIWLKNAHDFIISEPGGSVYVPPDEVYYGNEMRIFNGRLSYYKGAYVLHMIRYELGDDALFFQVMRNFQEAFADSVATSHDFINVLNQTTEKDFTGFFNQWFFGEGYPIYNLDWSHAEGVFELISSQSASAGDITPFFIMRYPVRIFLSNGDDTTIQIEQVQPLVVKTVTLEEGVDSIQVDPDHWVLKRVDSINGLGESQPGNSIDISPNPAHDLLFLSTHKTQFLQGSIYDLHGKAVLSFEADKSDFSLDVSHLESGLYLIRLVSDGRTLVHKFVKH